jgi:hypothetical protein
MAAMFSTLTNVNFVRAVSGHSSQGRGPAQKTGGQGRSDVKGGAADYEPAADLAG